MSGNPAFVLCDTCWDHDYQKDPKEHCVHIAADGAADKATTKSVSRIVERCGKHMLDCSVATQAQVALSSDAVKSPGYIMHEWDLKQLRPHWRH